MTTHSLNLFNNNRHQLCQQDDVLKCNSVERIKIVIVKFNEAINDFDQQTKHQNSKGLLQIIDEIFIQNNYTHTDLLNDYHHIKYFHNADNNDNIFAKIYEYCTNHIQIACNVSKCKLVQRHYRDRSTPSNQYIFEHHNDNYKIELISRIHVYFIHSYDINRLTLHEVNRVNEQLTWMNAAIGLDADEKGQNDTDLLQDKKMEMMSLIISKKTKKLNVTANNKYIQNAVQSGEVGKSSLQYDEIALMLEKHNIFIEITEIENAFAQYANYTDKFISDLIDVYYGKNETKLPLESLKCDTTIQSTVFRHILYNYFQKQHLNNENFIKIATIIINQSCPDIAINEFIQVVVNTGVDGSIFVKGQPNFKTSTKFANLFKSVSGFNRKKIAKIYIAINKWTPLKIEANSQIDIEPETKMEEEKVDEKIDDEDESQTNDVYTLGIRFYYWESHRYHPQYIDANHLNFKQEILNNKLFKFQVDQWSELEKECNALCDSEYVKKIVSNGYHEFMYKIKRETPFSSKHLMSLKLYTDYSTLCGTFCSTLRSENEMKISEIANWVRLLIECIQCYGSLLKTSQVKIYYRGISNTFLFEKFATQFNLPMSTTTDYCVAARFSGPTGLILDLRQYLESYDVFQFVCSPLSTFPEEKEVLFFGGSTVLKITSILQVLDGKWENYRKYMEPMNAIMKLINGFTIKQNSISTKKKQQSRMLKLIDYILNKATSKDKVSIQLPQYIQQLLKYQVSVPVIKLDFGELKTAYEWMRHIFIKSDAGNVNITNICVLFCDADEIRFKMPHDYVLNDFECGSLIQDLESISAMSMSVRISFKWPTTMPIINKQNINKYLQQILGINWSRNISNNCMLFESTVSMFSKTAQKRFQEILSKMTERPTTERKTSKSTAKKTKLIKYQTPLKIDKRDVELKAILTVEGYIRRCAAQKIIQLFPQSLIDLILWIYAKPVILRLKHKEEVKHILYCPVYGSWSSMIQKIESVFELIIDWNEPVQLKHETITTRNIEWCNFVWNEDMVFVVDIQSRKKHNLNKLTDQIEVLYSERAKAASYSLCTEKCIINNEFGSKNYGFMHFLEKRMNNKVVSKLFSKFKSDTIDAKQLVSLLTLVVVVYRMKEHKLRGHTTKPSLDTQKIKNNVLHLCAWIVRTFGEKTDDKQKIFVYDDNGKKTEGEFNVYTATFLKDKFVKDVKIWVTKYIDCNGQLFSN